MLNRWSTDSKRCVRKENLGEKIDYSSRETWNNFFSDLSGVSSEANIAIQLSEILQEKWEGKPVAEVFGEYKEFFKPEIVETEDVVEKRVKPWFLRFFGIGFSEEAEYDGFIYRYEYDKGLEDIRITIDPFDPDGLKFFKEFSDNADKALASAEEKEFEFSRTEVDPTLSNPEDIRKELIGLYEKMCNFLPIADERVKFLWSLSHGSLIDYAKQVYPDLDMEVLKGLGFEVDQTYDIIYAPSFEKASPVSMLMKMIEVLSEGLTKRRTVYETLESEKARKLLGIENSPADNIKEYYDETVANIKNKMSDWEKEVVGNVVDRVKGYSGGESYFHRKGYDEIDNLPRFSERPKLETLEACSPLLLAGVLQYDANSNAIVGWNKVAERW